MRIGLLACLCLVFATARALACGLPDDPCRIELGEYYAEAPEDADGAPILIYFHGAGQSGAMVQQRDRFLVEAFTDAGFVVVLPNGLKRPNSRFGPGWFFRPEAPGTRDELDFTHALIADAAVRFGGDPERVLLSGFSIGGSLVWYLACQDHDMARGYAPVGGGFWRPLPAAQTCTGPIDLLHTHGWRDQTVPLEGRPLRSGQIYQGDIFKGLAIWREINGCERLRADSFVTEGAFWRRVWSDCSSRQKLELALHPGGHGVPEDWPEMAVTWFKSLATP